jgi:hypothetical protein
MPKKIEAAMVGVTATSTTLRIGENVLSPMGFLPISA